MDNFPEQFPVTIKYSRWKEFVCIIFNHQWNEHTKQTVGQDIICEYISCSFCGVQLHKK